MSVCCLTYVWDYLNLSHDRFPFSRNMAQLHFALNLRLRTVDADLDVIDQTLILLGLLGKGKDGLLFSKCPFSIDYLLAFDI